MKLSFAIVLFVLLACLASTSFSQTFKWTNCGNENDVFQVETVAMSPDPAQPGQNVTIKANGVQSTYYFPSFFLSFSFFLFLKTTNTVSARGLAGTV